MLAEMEIEETPGSSLFHFRQIKLSAMDIFISKVKGNGDKVFHSFEIYHNSHEVRVDRMKNIATYARTSFNISKPIMLPGLRFSQVTSKKEWMNRTLDIIGVPKYPSSMEELFAIGDPNQFCFARAMESYWILLKDYLSMKRHFKESQLIQTVGRYMRLKKKSAKYTYW